MTLAALPPRAFPFPVADDKLTLPDDIVERTRAKYVDAYRRLTGREIG